MEDLQALRKELREQQEARAWFEEALQLGKCCWRWSLVAGARLHWRDAGMQARCLVRVHARAPICQCRLLRAHAMPRRRGTQHLTAPAATSPSRPAQVELGLPRSAAPPRAAATA